MRSMTGLALASLLLVAVFAMAPAAQAQEAGEQTFEIYAGYYVPGIDDLDNDWTYGVRYGSRPSENWGWNIGAGYFDLEQNGDDRPLERFITSANAWLIDLSGIWFIRGSDFGIFAGLGWATVDIDLRGTTQDESDDALTYNYGVQYSFNFGDNSVLKPEVRWRKFDGDTYEKTDEQYTLTYGWRF